MTTQRLPKILWLAACLVATPACMASTRGQPRTSPAAALDLRGYADELGQCASALARLRQDPRGILRFRQSLPAEWDVRAGKRTYRVSTDWLDSALAQIESQPAQAATIWRDIVERLAFLRAQADALESGAAAPAQTAASGPLEAIFRRHEFRGLAGPSAFERWWRRLAAWVYERIAWLLEQLHLGAASGNAIAYGLIAAALVLLALWGWRSLAGRGQPAAMRIDRGERAGDPRAWAREALGAADRGEFREAIHCAYWAAVARLEDLGAIRRRDPSRTPREMVRQIDSQRTEREPFGALTAQFEAVWYGFRSPSVADWENTKTQLERIGCLGFSTPETASF